jgi:very-short-patch-repair endonuclease
MRDQQKLSFAKTLRSRMTDAERKIWYHLRASRLERMKFVRQKPIGRYVVDFCCSGGKLIVELDGGQHYFKTDRDAERTAFLNNEGYRVIRFSDTDALKNTPAVLDRIRSALFDIPSSPLPLPPPLAGEGENNPRTPSYAAREF